MKNKLILVEGIPGAGKSTIAKRIYDLLKKEGYNVKLYREGDECHPVDFDGVAYFDNQFFVENLEFQKLHGMFSSFFQESISGYTLNFKKLFNSEQIKLCSKTVKKILENDIYELNYDKHYKLIISKWEQFVHGVGENEIIIFECCFIQNPITYSLIRNNFSLEGSFEYIRGIYNMIIALNPLLIYLTPQDINVSLENIIKERPKEWRENFFTYYLKGEFGIQNKYKGIEGILKILKKRIQVEKYIYSNLDLDIHHIITSVGDTIQLDNDLQLILNNFKQKLTGENDDKSI